jgi:hypothetical protein
MTRLPTTEALIDLADGVVSAGFDAHRHTLSDVVVAARTLGVRPVLADIVADAAAPRPVRERALGRLIVALSATAVAAEQPGATHPASAA